MALLDQPPVVKKILAHPPPSQGQVLGLSAKVRTKPEDSIWLPKKSTLRGPPDELLPPDLEDTGGPVDLDAVDEDLSEPFFDGLPADDWVA